MRFLAIVLLISFTSISGCKSQDKMVFGSQDVVEDKEEKKTEVDYETLEIENALGIAKWEHITNTKSINIYRIDSVLVDTVKKEYGRKLEKINSVNTNNVTSFIETIKNKNNYPVLSNDLTGFNPSHLFEFCAEKCELSLLFDHKNDKLSFINLDGQKIVSLSKELTDYLNNTIIKE